MELIACQWNLAWEDKQANYAKARELLKEAAPQPGSLVVLPEMFATGFTMNTEAIAEGEPSPTEQFVGELAKAHNCFIIAGLARQQPSGKPQNRSVAFTPEGKLLSSYSKIQPFTLGGELDAYAAGSDINVFSWNEGKVAQFICYDLRFPEIFRTAALAQRPEVFTVIASWPEKRTSHWVALLRARAIENQAYVVGVNRCGSDPHFQYSGRTLIIEPSGEIIADAGDAECFVRATPDFAAVADLRRGLPFLDDMRSEFISG